jgi:hypothetical protein
MDSSEDTDTLLALLCSVLPDTIAPSNESLLEALLQTDGDVQKAAEIVSKQHLNGLHNKRKRNVSLDNWLTRAASSKHDNGQSSAPDSTTERSRLGSESPNKKPRSASASGTPAIAKNDPLTLSKPIKPVKNLLDVLRQPPDVVTSGIPRLSPLTLGNPSLVAQHTPCTLHLGILPQELASHLFHTMLHEAQEWSRNKWWLFDRLVESPHRSSLYTRHPVEGNNEAAWQGITRAW